MNECKPLGGGAKKYAAELKEIYGMEDGSVASTAGGFQAMTTDLLSVLNDIPFSIPPYFALLGEALQLHPMTPKLKPPGTARLG